MPIFDPRERSFPVLPTLIIANMLPLVGIIYYDLSFFALFYLYWWETVMLSIVQFLKMGRAQKHDQPDPNYKVNGKMLTEQQVNNRGYMRRTYFFFRFFMLIFYFIFIILFVGLMPAAQNDGGLEFAEALLFMKDWMVISFVAFIITHTLEYIVWVKDEEYKTTSLRQLGSPFDSRIIVMHIVIVLGTFTATYASDHLMPGNPKASSIAYAAIFVALKTILDLYAYTTNQKKTAVLSGLFLKGAK